MKVLAHAVPGAAIGRNCPDGGGVDCRCVVVVVVDDSFGEPGTDGVVGLLVVDVVLVDEPVKNALARGERAVTVVRAPTLGRRVGARRLGVVTRHDGRADEGDERGDRDRDEEEVGSAHLRSIGNGAKI